MKTGRDPVDELAVQVRRCAGNAPNGISGWARTWSTAGSGLTSPSTRGNVRRFFSAKKRSPVGLLVLDGEADEILGRLALLPVHREQGHAVAAMQFEGKERRRVLAADLKFTSHRSLRQHLVRSRAAEAARRDGSSQCASNNNFSEYILLEHARNRFPDRRGGASPRLMAIEQLACSIRSHCRSQE